MRDAGHFSVERGGVRWAEGARVESGDGQTNIRESWLDQAISALYCIRPEGGLLAEHTHCHW